MIMKNTESISRRGVLRVAGQLAAAAAAWSAPVVRAGSREAKRKPNVVLVFADQWRAQATGYAGDPNVRTPVLDRLARQSVVMNTAVSTCPVCSPYRASLLTGQYAHTHGVFLNDVCLNNEAVSLAGAFGRSGYQTGYIGKWHLDGHGRSSFISRQRRQGFEFWKVLECTHDYNRSFYYGDEDTKLQWEGYDAVAQTREAHQYIRDHAGKGPFALVLSWGPPHNPYNTAPKQSRDMYQPERMVVRQNVPPEKAAEARRDLAGYYAHISALDQCVGTLWDTLRDNGLEDDTIFVFTSDHGDMLGSQGLSRKQKPYDESVLVPLIVHWPRVCKERRDISVPIGTPDIMPTLLGLCGIEIPRTVEGLDFSGHVRGGAALGDGAALIACYAPFGEWTRDKGGREYRGVRTARYTYVRDLKGPWLLFDDERDPYQLGNLCNQKRHSLLQAELEGRLQAKLREVRDEFEPAEHYIRKWNYVTDASGTVPYKD